MSTTVTMKKAAAACTGLVAGKRQVVYFLFERTYERNVHPHTPEWHCCAVGVYEEVMRWVLRGADSCAGGMLQSRTGLIHPSNYVQAWRRVMDDPVEIDSAQKIYLKNGGSWDAPVPASKVDEVVRHLLKLGIGKGVEELAAAKTIEFGVQDCLQVVVDLYGVGGVIGQPWRVIKNHTVDLNGAGNPKLGPMRRTGSLQLPTFEAFSVSREVPPPGRRDNMVVCADNGPLEGIAYQSQALSWCLDKFCYVAEMTRTGGTKTVIHAMTQAIDQITPLPDGTRVHLDRGQGSETRFDEIAASLGLGEKTDFQTISVPLGTLRDRALLEALRAVLPSYVRFERATLT